MLKVKRKPRADGAHGGGLAPASVGSIELSAKQEELLQVVGHLLMQEPYRSQLAELLLQHSPARERTGHEVDPMVDLTIAKQLSGLGKTAIYSRVRDGRFPVPHKVGSATRWRRSEIEHWREQFRP